MASNDRRRQQQTALHKVATPPAPLLLMPASQGLTFSSDDVRLPGVFMPMPLANPQLAVDEVEVDSFVGQAPNMSSYADNGLVSQSTAVHRVSPVPAQLSDNHFINPVSSEIAGGGSEFSMSQTQPYLVDELSSTSQSMSNFPPVAVVNPLHGLPPLPAHAAPPLFDVKSLGQNSASATPVSVSGSGLRRVSAPPAVGNIYVPVPVHWFYCKNVELRQIWRPFSAADSENLELAFQSLAGDPADKTEPCVVSVEGGRYDVHVSERTRHAVYWDEAESFVRRCTWFYRAEADNRLMPYDEEFAACLEDSYKTIVTSNDWHRKLEYPSGDIVIIHSPTVIMHVTPQPHSNVWTTAPEVDSPPPRVAKRGIEEIDNIPNGESQHVDHLIFVVHGIGPGCDLRFRNIVECVDDFRAVSAQMLEDHFKEHQERGRIGRVEYLPVRWHSALHGDATGIDRKLKAITLNSIGKLRQFTNDTLLDVLFYGSPAYAQQIADTVGSEINHLYELFCTRNPSFHGGVSLAGHSLGSLILFDLLVHQNSGDLSPTTVEKITAPTATGPVPPTAVPAVTAVPPRESVVHTPPAEEEMSVEVMLQKLGLSDYHQRFVEEQMDVDALLICEDADLKGLGLPLGPRKKLLSFLQEYKQKQLQVAAGEPAPLPAEASSQPAQVVTTEQTCHSHQNDNGTSHEMDPLLRSASNTSVNFIVGGGGTGIPLVKYPQLLFKPCNFFALGSPIAMFLTVRGVNCLGESFHLPTCSGFFNIFHPFDPVAYRIEPMVIQGCPVKPVLMPHHKGRKRLHLELRDSLSRVGSDLKQRIIESVKSTWRTINDLAHYRRGADDISSAVPSDSDIDSIVRDATSYYEENAPASSSQSVLDEEYPIGKLNHGRRVDYVLQEKPIESFNDYLFALSSHACYWESEDTALMMLKEIYALIGVSPAKPGTEVMPSQHTAPPFPRHPLTTHANQGIPLPVQPQFAPFASSSAASHAPGGSSTAPPSSTHFGAPVGAVVGPPPGVVGPPLAAVRSPYVGSPAASQMGASPAMGASPVVGPPPRAGFVRK